MNHPVRGFRVRRPDRQAIVLTMCAEFEVPEDELVVERGPRQYAHLTVPLADDSALERLRRALGDFSYNLDVRAA